MIQVWNNIISEVEISKFKNAVVNKQIMEGEILEIFQKKFAQILGIKYAVGVSSGTAALALALLGIGIQPGDEVIVPDLTFIATANAPYILGAKVVLAPTIKGKTLMDLQAIDALITEKTKAIIIVDLNGRVISGKELKDKYADKGIFIVEDACQALMSKGKDGMAGTTADIGCFSFGITKTVSTVQGGMVITNNEELYKKMKIIKTQGMTSVFEGNDYCMPGFNFKLPDVLAAIGLGQLERLQEKILHMKKIDKLYMERLRDVLGISFLERKEEEFIWMTDILCENRNEIRDVLMQNNIISRPLGAPLHTAYYLEKRCSYENASEMQKKLLFLPSGPDQPLENVEKTIEVLRKCG